LPPQTNSSDNRFLLGQVRHAHKLLRELNSLTVFSNQSITRSSIFFRQLAEFDHITIVLCMLPRSILLVAFVSADLISLWLRERIVTSFHPMQLCRLGSPDCVLRLWIIRQCRVCENDISQRTDNDALSL
jgi:hypothetical protein